MRRVPVLPTLLVAAAVAAMIALGVWQLHRLRWKEALIARYEAAATLPPVGFPRVPTDQSLLFRRSEVFCLQPTAWRASAGRDRTGRSGYRHVADCRTGAEGPGVAIDMGWSDRPEAPGGWRGGRVTGTIGPDRNAQVLLVADEAAPGLVPSARPDVAVVSNNHLAYAVQWFLFAAIAAIIYAVALWRRPPR
ncbi:SURF1 family protein [Sphingomonas sp.]|uniref:SURF1 family protein n=1 Tax=Sphingomonas sp. TaxID=28214 RepID=UPI003AFFE5C9